MKLRLNFEYLEAQWKERQIDLFPWLQGLRALLRSREANLKVTRKKLSSSTPATMVQFLSSYDPETSKIAQQIIKVQNPSSILPILLYSLEKTDQNNYISRVIKSLLDFDPITSFGYFLGYLNDRAEFKKKYPLKPQRQYLPLDKNREEKILFQVIRQIFSNLNSLFASPQEKNQFLCQIFEALSIDLNERMPLSGIFLETREDFHAVKLDLEVILTLFTSTMYDKESAQIVEEKMHKLGQEIIISLHKITFDFRKNEIMFDYLLEVMQYIAILRLEADKPFLESVPEKLKNSELPEEKKIDIIEKSETAIRIIDQPETPIHVILNELETPFFL